MRFGKIENPTVRFGAVLRKWKYYRAVRCCDISYGAVRCGSVRFSEIVNATVRFGAVFICREPYDAVRLYFMYYGAVRCGCVG